LTIITLAGLDAVDNGVVPLMQRTLGNSIAYEGVERRAGPDLKLLEGYNKPAFIQPFDIIRKLAQEAQKVSSWKKTGRRGSLPLEDALLTFSYINQHFSILHARL
jgi:hypothetical protein